MTLFEQCASISRTAAIQAGAQIERTNEEMLQDILVSEPALAEARKDLERMVQEGKLSKEVLQ